MISVIALLAAQLVCNGAVIPITADTHLPAGECTLPKPIILTIPTTISGAANLATHIMAPRGFVGSNSRLTLRDLYIQRADFAIATATRAIGINVVRPPDLQRMRVEGFTIGVLIVGARALENNVDFFVLRELEIINSAHTAILVDGGASNAGYAEHIRSIHSCKRAAQWEATFGPCAGVVDSSYLGNTWAAIQISDTYNTRPPLISVGASQASTWIGVYCETGQPAPVLSPRSVMIGGACTGVPLNGLRIVGRQFSAGEFVNDQDAKNVTRVKLGRSAGPGDFNCYTADAIDKSRSLCLESWVRGDGLKDKCYAQRIANMTRVGEICQDGSKK